MSYTVITVRKLVTPTRYFVSLAIGKLKHVAGHAWVSIGCMEVGCMSYIIVYNISMTVYYKR